MARDEYEKGYADGRRNVREERKMSELEAWGRDLKEALVGTGRHTDRALDAGLGRAGISGAEPGDPDGGRAD